MVRAVKNYTVLIYGIFLVSISCQKESDKTFYETGEIKTERTKIENSDSMSYFVEYFKNGQKKLEGFLKFDSIADGDFKYYYADGKLSWAGQIKANIIQDEFKWHWKDCQDCFKGIEIEGEPDSLIEGRSYRFRVIMPKVNPRFYTATDIHYKDLTVPEPADTFNYPFSFKFLPNENGAYFIRIVFMNKNGKFIIGEPSIIVTITDTLSN